MKILKKIGIFFSALSPIFTYLIVNICVIIVFLIISMILKLRSNSFDNNLGLGNFDSIAELVINISCFIAAIVKMKQYDYKFSDISPVKQNWKVYLTALLFISGAVFVLVFINSLFLKITGIPLSHPPGEISGSELTNILAYHLTLPFVEELIFRGLMVKNFEKKGFPILFSACAITISYALLYSKEYMLYILLFGAIIIFIRYRFGDIKLCILIQFTANLIRILILLANAELYNTILKVGSAVGVVVAAASMFFMIKFASKPAAADNAG